jgi:hypothetical protein
LFNFYSLSLGVLRIKVATSLWWYFNFFKDKRKQLYFIIKNTIKSPKRNMFTFSLKKNFFSTQKSSSQVIQMMYRLAGA